MQERLFSATLIALLSSVGAHAALDVPQPVSPGDPVLVTVVPEVCPTFSWTAVDGAAGYELRVRRGSAPASPAAFRRSELAEVIDGPATSWTPAMHRCLESDQDYAWIVRAIDPAGAYRGRWSQPLHFRIDAMAGGSAEGSGGRGRGRSGNNGKGGIPEVLAQLAAMQEQMAAMQAQIEANQLENRARFDMVEATQGEHGEVLARVRTFRRDGEKFGHDEGLLFGQGQLCFQLEGGLDAELALGALVMARTEGKLGIAVYGPEASANAKGDVKAKVEAKLGGAGKVGLSYCFAGPGIKIIDGSKSTDDPLSALGDALRNSEDIVLDLLASSAPDLGLDLAMLGENIEGGIEALKALELPSNPFELLDPSGAARQSISEITGLLPVPQKLRDRIGDLEGLVPSSLDELNVCSSAFRYPIPDTMPISSVIDKACDVGNRMLDLVGLDKTASFDDLTNRGIEKIEDLLELRDQLLAALEAIIRIEDALDTVSDPAETIKDRVCNALPPRARPPLCN